MLALDMSLLKSKKPSEISEGFSEFAEMAYLWQVPHRIDGRKLEAAIGTIPHTPFETAIMDTLEGFDLLKKRA